MTESEACSLPWHGNRYQGERASENREGAAEPKGPHGSGPGPSSAPRRGRPDESPRPTSSVGARPRHGDCVSPCMRWLLGLLWGAGVVSLGSLARAQPPSTASAAHSVNSTPHEVRTSLGPRRWYGWKTLAIDGAALGLVGVALVAEAGRHSEETAAMVIAGSGAAVNAL